MLKKYWVIYSDKEEIDFCNNISDYVRGLYDEVNLK